MDLEMICNCPWDVLGPRICWLAIGARVWERWGKRRWPNDCIELSIAISIDQLTWWMVFLSKLLYEEPGMGIWRWDDLPYVLIRSWTSSSVRVPERSQDYQRNYWPSNLLISSWIFHGRRFKIDIIIYHLFIEPNLASSRVERRDEESWVRLIKIFQWS